MLVDLALFIKPPNPGFHQYLDPPETHLSRLNVSEHVFGAQIFNPRVGNTKILMMIAAKMASSSLPAGFTRSETKQKHSC